MAAATRQNTHRFTNLFNNREDPELYCDLKVSVREETYHEKSDTFYYISYDYSYGTQPDSKKLHPFFGKPRLYTDHSDGEIIVKNKISEAQVEYLLMDTKELEKHTGNTCVYRYIMVIMKQIMLAWD
jgi:hypothetical protein